MTVDIKYESKRVTFMDNDKLEGPGPFVIYSHKHNFPLVCVRDNELSNSYSEVFKIYNMNFEILRTDGKFIVEEWHGDEINSIREKSTIKPIREHLSWKIYYTVEGSKIYPYYPYNDVKEPDELVNIHDITSQHPEIIESFNNRYSDLTYKIMNASEEWIEMTTPKVYDFKPITQLKSTGILNFIDHTNNVIYRKDEIMKLDGIKFEVGNINGYDVKVFCNDVVYKGGDKIDVEEVISFGIRLIRTEESAGYKKIHVKDFVDPAPIKQVNMPPRSKIYLYGSDGNKYVIKNNTFNEYQTVNIKLVEGQENLEFTGYSYSKPKKYEDNMFTKRNIFKFEELEKAHAICSWFGVENTAKNETTILIAMIVIFLILCYVISLLMSKRSRNQVLAQSAVKGGLFDQGLYLQ